MKIWQRDCCTQQLGSPVFEFIHNPLNFNNAIMLLLIYTKTKSIIIHYNYTLHLLFNCTKLRWGLFSFFNETLDNKICMTILLGFIGSMAYSESGKICLLNSHSLIMVYQGYAVCLMRLTSHIKYNSWAAANIHPPACSENIRRFDINHLFSEQLLEVKTSYQ